MGSVLDRLLEELERDPEGTKKLAEKLLSSLLHHEIRQIREELSKAITLSDESAKSFQAELVKLREDFNRMLREMSQRFEAHDKKFDEIVKRLEEHDKKFDEIVKRLEEHDKKFITLEEQMNKGFENTERYFRYLASTLEDIKRSIGISLEYYTSHFIEVLLKEKGFKDFTVNAHVNLFNPVNKAFKEIDILCIEPLVVGEVTTVLNSVKKAEEELNKLLDNAKFAEELFGKSSFMKLLAVENAPQEVFDYLKSKSKELGITLITGKEIK